jgi:hypothetical protein
VTRSEKEDLAAFEQAVVEQPGNSCSACSDCDYERLAAYNEIQRLRAAQRRPPRRWWRWGYRV